MEATATTPTYKCVSWMHRDGSTYGTYCGKPATVAKAKFDWIGRERKVERYEPICSFHMKVEQRNDARYGGSNPTVFEPIEGAVKESIDKAHDEAAARAAEEAAKKQ